MLSMKACRGQRAIKPEAVSCFSRLRWLRDTITQHTHDVTGTQIGSEHLLSFETCILFVSCYFKFPLHYYYILEISVHI